MLLELSVHTTHKENEKNPRSPSPLFVTLQGDDLQKENELYLEKRIWALRQFLTL